MTTLSKKRARPAVMSLPSAWTNGCSSSTSLNAMPLHDKMSIRNTRSSTLRAAAAAAAAAVAAAQVLASTTTTVTSPSTVDFTAQLVEQRQVPCRKENNVADYLQESGNRIQAQECSSSDDSTLDETIKKKSKTRRGTITILPSTEHVRRIVRRNAINGKHSIVFSLNNAMRSPCYRPKQEMKDKREMTLTEDDASDCIRSVPIPLKGMVQYTRFNFRTQLNSFLGIPRNKLSLTVNSFHEAIWFYEASHLSSDKPCDLMKLIINTNYYAMKQLSCSAPWNANGVSHDPKMFKFFESPVEYYLELGRWIAKWCVQPPKECSQGVIKLMVENFDNILCIMAANEWHIDAAQFEPDQPTGDASVRLAISQHCERARSSVSSQPAGLEDSILELDLLTHNAIRTCFTQGTSLYLQGLSCASLFLQYPPNTDLPRLGIAKVEKYKPILKLDVSDDIDFSNELLGDADQTNEIALTAMEFDIAIFDGDF